MSKQYHYVVIWDTETNSWSIDWDGVSINYDNGHIWDENAQEWLSKYEDIEDYFCADLNKRLTNG